MEIVEIWLDAVDSTQDYAKRCRKSFAPDRITCVLAEEQTAGRGRFLRRWVSPRAVNLYATFYFQLPVETPDLTCLSLLMAHSLATVLSQEGLDPQVKWPNDVQLHGKKVAGILTETIFSSQFVEVFLGIGVNVNMGKEELAQIDQPATSLKQETRRSWDKKRFFEKLQKQFLQDLSILQKEGFAPFHSAVEARLSLKEQTIVIFDGEKKWIGICHGLSSSGQLQLILPDQTQKILFSGEIRGNG